jgi:thiazole synthase
MCNTAVATAGNIGVMAKAFALAVESGRLAYLSGTGRVLETAEASSPLTDFIR